MRQRSCDPGVGGDLPIRAIGRRDGAMNQALHEARACRTDGLLHHMRQFVGHGKAGSGLFTAADYGILGGE